MLRPATGAGPTPRLGVPGAGVEASSGLDFEAGLSFGSRLLCGSSGWSRGTAALAFLGEAAAVDFALLSEGAVCFFSLSSASSVWMRCSIFSSFFSKTSFASPSAALTPLQPMIDIAVAASRTFCLVRRSLGNLGTGKRENWCNGITTPKSRGNQGSATSRQLTPLQNVFGIRNEASDWNRSTLELEQN